MYTITKSKKKTNDGLHVYNFTELLPLQLNNYVKIHNLFLKDDKQALKVAERWQCYDAVIKQNND